MALQSHSIDDFFFDAIAALEAVLKSDEVPMWILTFDGTQGWSDLFLLPVGDTVALGFNSLILRRV